MADLQRRIREARHVVEVSWTPSRARAAEGMLGARRARRTRRLAAAASAAAALFVGLVVLFGRGRAEPPRVAGAHLGALAATWGAAPERGPRAPVTLVDGTVIEPRARAIVLARSITSKRVEYDVAKGSAAFDVTHDDARVFRVTAGDVSVEVLGTAFSVDRDDAEVRVSVARGRVRVRWAGGVRELGVGDAGVFPAVAAPTREAAPASDGDGGGLVEPREAFRGGDAKTEHAAPDAALAPKPTTARSEAALDPLPPDDAARPTWSALAKAGDYDKAYDALHAESATPPRDAPDELLLAADVARLSGHPAQAIEPLRRVARDHRGDPRAALAAFTLGRVLLDSLGRPREAADAFADARALGGGGLGEEALAREVEARSRAGDADRARTLAEQYVARFPEGKRSRAVKKFGGLP